LSQQWGENSLEVAAMMIELTIKTEDEGVNRGRIVAHEDDRPR
jgi:hypothetical protein